MTQPLTAAEARKLLAKPKRSKYGSRITVVDGIKFHSAKEARRHQELVLLKKAGQIFNLERQPRFPLIVNDCLIGTYVGDWQYQTAAVQGLSYIVEDAKGMQTPLFRLKWKLVHALYPLIEWRLI